MFRNNTLALSSLPGNFEEDTASFIPSLAPSGSFEQRLLDDTLLDGESSVMFLEPSASGDDVEVLLLSAVSRRRASPHRARDPAFSRLPTTRHRAVRSSFLRRVMTVSWSKKRKTILEKIAVPPRRRTMTRRS